MKEVSVPRPLGRPVVAILALLVLWVGGRSLVWESPFPIAVPERLFAEVQADVPDFVEPPPIGLPQVTTREPRLSLQETYPSLDRRFAAFMAAEPSMALAPPGIGPQVRRSRVSGAHQLMYAAAFSYLPSILEEGGMAASFPAVRAPDKPKPVNRWTADAWLLLRAGDAPQSIAGVAPASYGADQIGAVVRYRLAPGGRFNPAVYGRASRALVSRGETEAAIGAQVDLAQSFPLSAHVEARVTRRAGGDTEVRPAAFIVSGLPRSTIVGALEAEGYVQAGYVGGDFDTGFIDGRATIEAPVFQRDAGRIAVGAGLWGGAQRDAARLDIGPTASALLGTEPATVRASVDYRLRIAGDAAPGDGVAVTLSASF